MRGIRVLCRAVLPPARVCLDVPWYACDISRTYVLLVIVTAAEWGEERGGDDGGGGAKPGGREDEKTTR